MPAVNLGGLLDVGQPFTSFPRLGASSAQGKHDQPRGADLGFNGEDVFFADVFFFRTASHLVILSKDMSVCVFWKCQNLTMIWEEK